jgi:hypothetical protein
MTRERFAGDHQIKRLQRIVRAAMAGRNAVPQPAGCAQRAHPAYASRVNVAMSRVAVLYIGSRLPGPLVQLLGEGAMRRVEEWEAQMRGPAHMVLLPARAWILHANKPHNHASGKSLHFLPRAADWPIG